MITLSEAGLDQAARVRRAVSDYIVHHRDDAVAELDFFRAMPILRHAIEAAASRAHRKWWEAPAPMADPLQCPAGVREVPLQQGVRLTGSTVLR